MLDYRSVPGQMENHRSSKVPTYRYLIHLGRLVEHEAFVASGSLGRSHNPMKRLNGPQKQGRPFQAKRLSHFLGSSFFFGH